MNNHSLLKCNVWQAAKLPAVGANLPVENKVNKTFHDCYDLIWLYFHHVSGFIFMYFLKRF